MLVNVTQEMAQEALDVGAEIAGAADVAPVNDEAVAQQGGEAQVDGVYRGGCGACGEAPEA